MNDDQPFPWAASGGDFDAAMRIIETRNPLSPNNTIVRRILCWNIVEKMEPWPMPDDMDDMDAWWPDPKAGS